MGMIQACLDLDFAHEAVRQLREPAQIGQKNLGGLNAVEKQVPDFVDPAHAAHTQHFDDLVITEDGAGFEAHLATSETQASEEKYPF